MGDNNNNPQRGPIESDPCPEPLPQRSSKWYVRYYSDDDLRCVMDCIGDPPCDDRPTSYKEVYDTFHICCAIHLWWSQECSLYDANGFAIEEEPCFDLYWDTEADEIVSSVSVYYADCESCCVSLCIIFFHI